MSIAISPRALGETADNLPPELPETGRRCLSIFASAPGDAMRDGGTVVLELAFETLNYDRLGIEEQEPGDCVLIRAGRMQLLSPYAAWMADQVEPPDSGDPISTYTDWLKSPENEERGAHVETFRNLQRGFASIDFENRHVLVEGGYAPSFAEPKFVAQMVFGVVTMVKGNFEIALGREIITGLDRADGGRPGVLTLNPWSSMEAQAWYDRRSNTLNFGLYESRSDAHGYSQGSIVFTGLSHDVVVHELCHALLDSVRPNLMLPVNMDVPAFHEAFCDIIAVLQRFSYPDLVVAELQNEQADLSGSDMLNTLARSFAETAGHGPTVRDIVGDDKYDSAPADPHGRSEILVQAIYRAFLNVAEDRIKNVISLASNGTGILPEGTLPQPLLNEMSRQVRKTAQMFQMMLIRALDYCPPVGIEFFDVLRSVLAADRELVPNDESHVRQAWIDAFRQSGIFAPSSEYYSEESLVAEVEVEPSELLTLNSLSFGETRFRSSPGKPLSLGPATEQIRSVIEELGKPHWLDAIFGKDVENSTVTLISLRNFARPGPSGMTQFGTSIELLREPLDGPARRLGPLSIDGATLVFNSEGCLIARCRRRYDDAHLAWSRQYAESVAGKAFWTVGDEGLTVRSNYQRRMCML